MLRCGLVIGGFAAGGLRHAALAQEIFTCDVAGRHITADLPPSECGSVQIRVLNRDGSPNRTIEPPITPEQRRRRELEEERARRDEQIARDQRRRDLALLETYANPEEIRAARDRALISRQSVIDRALERLHDYQVERKKLDDESEFYAHRALPPTLQHSIEVNDDLQHKEEKVVADMKVEMQRISDRFDSELQRFNELMASGATPRKKQDGSP